MVRARPSFGVRLLSAAAAAGSLLAVSTASAQQAGPAAPAGDEPRVPAAPAAAAPKADPRDNLIPDEEPSRGVPAKQVIAASATQPSTTAAKSRLTLSPSFSRWSCGRPCSTASLTDVHSTLPKGIAPNDGW